ncbi:TniQ family protein [Nocardia asteroides]|uniref:TniQ family protein n=1 Tax=Nocardia asteroides TaxID=1824 RepID=UPI0037B16755
MSNRRITGPRSSPLPRSLAPLDDETLPGYILRLSHRLDLAPAQVIDVTGLRSNTTIGTTTAILGLPERTLATFARITRLEHTEASELLMTSLADRYPPLDPTFLGRFGELRAIVSGEPWVLVSSTRYCNQCLAGDGSTVQEAHGGAWKRAWRLPITFACLTHRRLLAHRCEQCGHRIHNRAGSTGPHGLILHSTIAGLHPAQCRSPLRLVKPGDGKRAMLSACGFRLDRTHDAPAVDTLTMSRLLAVQRDLTLLLENRGSTALSCGLESPAPNYFVDLRVVTELLSSSWPAARAFAPSAAIAIIVDKTVEARQPEISTQRNGRIKTHRAAPHRRPPLPADECGALLSTATQILGTLKSPADAAELLAELLEHDRTRQPTSSIGLTDRVLQRAQNDCSPGLRTAIDIITQKMP